MSDNELKPFFFYKNGRLDGDCPSPVWGKDVNHAWNEHLCDLGLEGVSRSEVEDEGYALIEYHPELDPTRGDRIAWLLEQLDSFLCDPTSGVKLDRLTAAYENCVGTSSGEIAAWNTRAPQWQPIETAPQDGRLYEVSNHGQVRVGGKIRESYFSDSGYEKVSIGSKSVSVHGLVAKHFIPNPKGLLEVNHKDGNKANNIVENLEWCTRSENMKHAYRIGLHRGVCLKGADSPNWKRNGKRHPQSMAVRAVFPDGTFCDYESQRLAELDGFSSSKISLCISGKRKYHGGAAWMPLPAPPEAPTHD